MVNIAIFASGSGTNTQRIIEYFRNHKSIYIAIVFSNNSDAYVLERAKNNNIPGFVFSKKELNETEFVIYKLTELHIDFIVLAGFMIKIPDNILKSYPDKIINIHPALLPKYGGKGMYGMKVHEAVIAAKETESGVTIHYVNEHYDEGKIIFQAKCSVEPNDTPETLANKIHELEYKYYPVIIEKVITGSLVH